MSRKTSLLSLYVLLCLSFLSSVSNSDVATLTHDISVCVHITDVQLWFYIPTLQSILISLALLSD